MRRGIAGAAVAAIAAFLCGPAQAAAARGLETGLGPDPVYQSSDSPTREAALDRTVAARASVVRIGVSWAATVRGQAANAADPADPAYDFSSLDAIVRDTAARGLDPLLTVSGAPTFAEGPDRPASAPSGTWKPDPAALSDFATAIASRYSGAFMGLPRVRYFQAWNEPNLSNYLSPQYEDQRAVSPGHYRRMLNAVYDGVKSVHGDNVVVTGGTAPYGDPPGGNRMRPLAFLRDVLCLEDRKRLRPVDCPEKARFDILAHHPINTSGGPRRSAIHPDDVSTPDFKHVRRVLRAAERHQTTGTSNRHRLWATEVWWDSNPPDGKDGIPVQRHARYIEEALYLLWKQGAQVVINLQLQDEVFDVDNPFADRSTGVLFADGSPKPAFTAFRFPFVAERAKNGRLRYWGRSPAAGELVIQKRAGGEWRAVKRRRVSPDQVFTGHLSIEEKAALRAQVAGERSLTWRQR